MSERGGEQVSDLGGLKKTGVLFVCLGNICRSPTAHGIFQGLVDQAELSDLIFVDSAGTGDWHIGRSPDTRAQQAASQRGYDLGELRARQVSAQDFDRFDYVLAMDDNNYSDLFLIKPDSYKGNLKLFLEYGSRKDYREVPDPYYGGSENFELVLDLVEDAAAGLLNHIQTDHIRTDHIRTTRLER